MGPLTRTVMFPRAVRGLLLGASGPGIRPAFGANRYYRDLGCVMQFIMVSASNAFIQATW